MWKPLGNMWIYTPDGVTEKGVKRAHLRPEIKDRVIFDRPHPGAYANITIATRSVEYKLGLAMYHDDELANVATVARDLSDSGLRSENELAQMAHGVREFHEHLRIHREKLELQISLMNQFREVREAGYLEILTCQRKHKGRDPHSSNPSRPIEVEERDLLFQHVHGLANNLPMLAEPFRPKEYYQKVLMHF